jgi:serine/threonine-protein kinase
MEYVNGLPITRWCDERRLVLADRLRLFREVCAAVQYAHANLVVHCDLKAGNILVTDDGQPKLVDFGIATTLGVDAADAERRFLSPRSAAPEQFLGQPTSVATDVYALGVLLCELAGGSLPFDGDASVLVERVLHDAPRLPSEAAPERRRQLRGDIDAIVAKALAKAPHERYASVADLDADVAAYLATRPIAIRAAERGYRARLFVRRNALPVALTGVLALSVIGFGVFTLRQNERLVHERDQAQLERARALQVTDFVVGLFKAAKPEEARGREITARQLLERGRQQLGEALTEQPQLKAAMLAAIAEASFSLDDLQGGYLAARESLALLESLPSPPGRELASNLATLIRLENEFGRYAEALKCEEPALVLADQMDVSWRAEFAVQRAVTLYALARNKEATQVLRDSLALLEKEVALGDSRIVRVAVRLAIRLPGIEGEKLLAKYLPQDMGGLNRDDPLYGDLLVAVAIYWRARGDFDRAEKYAEDAVSAIARIYGENSSRITTAMNTLATIYHRRGDNEGSVRILMKALATLRRAYGETPNSARIEHNIGAILVDMGRVEEGLPYLERAVAIGTKSMSPDAHMLAFLRQELGWVLRDQRRYDEAEVMLRMALATYERDNNIGSQVDVRANLGCIAVERARKTGLKGEISAAIEILEKEKEPNRTGIASLRRCLDIAT